MFVNEPLNLKMGVMDRIVYLSMLNNENCTSLQNNSNAQKKNLFIRKNHIYIPIKLNIVLYLSGLNDIH